MGPNFHAHSAVAALLCACLASLPPARAAAQSEAAIDLLVHALSVEADALPEPAAEEATDLSAAPRAEADAPTKHYWRNAAELAVAIGLGASWYWLDRERQVGDWDYPSWKQKLTLEVLIYDDNPFRVNYTWHTFAGGSSQVLGRSNGLGLWEAAGFGLLSSVVWEYGIEAREKISFNDLLITNTTGIAAGEYFYRLSQYLQQGQQGLGWDVARWTVGFADSLHGALDGVSPHRGPTVDGRFDWSYAVRVADVTVDDGLTGTAADGQHALHQVGFRGKLWVLPERFRGSVARQGWFADANFTWFELSFAGGAGSATDAKADTLLAGWRSQAPARDGAIGHQVNLGTSIGYRYHREAFGSWRDRLGGLHLPGLAVDAEVGDSRFALRGDARAHADYMGVNALAWRRWQRDNPDEIGKSILQSSGYYYGWGGSLDAAVELELEPVAVGASLFHGRYWSQQGFDRLQDAFEGEELEGADRITDLETWLRVSALGPWFVEGRFGRHTRAGELGELEASESMRRYTLELGGSF